MAVTRVLYLALILVNVDELISTLFIISISVEVLADDYFPALLQHNELVWFPSAFGVFVDQIYTFPNFFLKKTIIFLIGRLQEHKYDRKYTDNA